jgi:predicted  nucleic acid-binding Zn-ribbon protein
MVIRRGVHEVYNAPFHPGLNIIRGENSSGKSTLLDFLFYGLGGDLTDWREAALACSEVLLEVSLNGSPAVLAREVSEASGRPMRIFLGTLDEADAAGANWGLYQYRRSESKESFSQVLFRLLGMPEATGDAQSNITMHQVLRLLYADQLTPVDRIFRFERFDTALTRQTVGDLLCGAYDNALYRHQLRLREAEKEYAAATSEWRNALSVFDGTEHSATMDWVNGERAVLLQKLDGVNSAISKLERKIFHAEVSDGLTLAEQERAYSEVVGAQEALLRLRSERDALQLEIADSEAFINALEAKLDQLRDAESAAELLDGIAFVYCPSCYAPIDETEDSTTCALCKAPFDKARAHGRVLAVINETGIQLKQSRLLQANRVDEATQLDSQIAEAVVRWNALSERYKLLNRLPSTELRSEARTLYTRAGYLERQLEDLAEKAAVIERIDALSRARQQLNNEINDLKEKIEVGERQQRDQLNRAYTRISSNTVEMLHSDLLRQDTFSTASSIAFSFGDDRIAVEGESFFSASSMVYLRNSFFAAFLKSALEDAKFRHPRFLMLDTIEDKGMEPERSHHFQTLLAEMSEASGVEHQLIYATAMIAPELEKSTFVVDRFYTHEDRSLKLLA